ncbi:MAG: hypothetical protein ACJASX_002908, partial [Limisphaerales bacterium]
MSGAEENVAETISCELVVENKVGIHARPAA